MTSNERCHFRPVVFKPDSTIIDVELCQGLTLGPIIDLIEWDIMLNKEFAHGYHCWSLVNRNSLATEKRVVPVTTPAAINQDEITQGSEEFKSFLASWDRWPTGWVAGVAQRAIEVDRDDGFRIVVDY